MENLYLTLNMSLHFLSRYVIYSLRKSHSMKSVQIRSFFWSVLSCFRTEYGDLLRKSPYSVQIQENMDQKKTPYLDTFQAVYNEKLMMVMMRIMITTTGGVQ